MRCAINNTPPSPINTLSLHDALPIYVTNAEVPDGHDAGPLGDDCGLPDGERGSRLDGMVDPVDVRLDEKQLRVVPDRLSGRDRKSTRLNSSHLVISYAVFCLKKKNLI